MIWVNGKRKNLNKRLQKTVQTRLEKINLETQATIKDVLELVG
jgi:hypothetical protein